ncbi:MAG TPA: hypothetical protein VIF09_20715, partial [Polyangiaceae bacterium]
MGNRSRSLARDALLRAKISERFAQDLRREVHLLGVRVRRRLDPVWRAREAQLRDRDDVRLH